MECSRWHIHQSEVRLVGRMILHDAGRDQGGFGAAESASQQLTVLREAAGLDMMFYRTQVETKVDGA